jgi:hypothetical protein
MKRLAIIVLLATLACRSSPSAGSRTPAPSEPVAQPKRSPADAERMRDADRALTAAIGNAKDAKTLVEACSGLDGLAKQLDALEHVTPPVGFERPFSEGRNGMGMTLGMMRDQDCAADSGMDADTIRMGLETLRKRFAELQQIGATP